MKDFASIAEVYPRLKLIRMIPSWDNLLGIPLAQRSVERDAFGLPIRYRSPNSFLSKDIIHSRHWKTKKLFVVFLSVDTELTLEPNERVVSIRRVTTLFEEDIADASADFKITQNPDGRLTLKLQVAKIDEDSELQIPDKALDTEKNSYVNANKMGNGYILTLK